MNSFFRGRIVALTLVLVGLYVKLELAWLVLCAGGGGWKSMVQLDEYQRTGVLLVLEQIVVFPLAEYLPEAALAAALAEERWVSDCLEENDFESIPHLRYNQTARVQLGLVVYYRWPSIFLVFLVSPDIFLPRILCCLS